MFGNGKRAIGKKIIELDDGTILDCDVDEFGEIIPETCQVAVEKVEGKSKEYSFPGMSKMPRR